MVKRASILAGRDGPQSRSFRADPTAALATLGGATYTWDLATDRLTWGPTAPAVLGLPVGVLADTGIAFRDWGEPHEGLSREDMLSSGERAYDLRYPLRLSPDTVIMVQDAGRVILGAGDRPALVRGCLRSDPASRERDKLAWSIDERSAFLCRLQEDVTERLRCAQGLTLVVGEIIADAPDMAETLRLVRSMMRWRDHTTVLSADRFALVLTSCSLDDASDAMKRLYGLLNAEGRCVRLVAAGAPDHALDACRLLRRAEAGLSRNEKASWRRKTARPADIIQALNDRQLGLALQPVADAQSLMRAFDRASLVFPCGTPLVHPPEPGLALLVDARKLDLAARYLLSSAEARIILPIEIETLRDRNWLSVLAAHLGAWPGIASRLILALPEAVLVEKAKVLGRLDAIKALGAGIALDGFGTGYATRSRLRSLPIDLACIAGVFIQTLNRSTGDRLMVRTLIDAAQHLGIATAAEWVDDPATADMIRAWGGDYLAGELVGLLERPSSRATSGLAKRA